MTKKQLTRKCWNCSETLPLTTKYFHRARSRPAGFGYICKACDNASKRANYRKNREAQIARVLEYRRKNREACNAYMRKWRARNRDALSTYERKRRRENHEAVNANERKRYRENRDAINDHRRKWRSENREAVNRHQRNYFRKYPDRKRAKAAIRDAIRRGHLIPEPCFACAAEKVDAHHEDYSKPYEILWLCRSCHTAYHDFLRQGAAPFG